MDSFYLEEKCAACGTSSNCFFRCVQCPVQYGQQMLLCKSCEQKVALYHFWEHTFASVKRWPLKTEALDKILANPDLQRFTTITMADHDVKCTSCRRDIEGVRYRLANPKEDIIDYCSLCFKLLRKTQSDAVWLKIRSIFEVDQSAAEEEQVLPSPRRPQERTTKGYQSEVSSVETSDDESLSGEFKTVQPSSKQDRRKSYYLPDNNYKSPGFYAPDTYGSPVTNSLPVPPVTLPPQSPPIRRTKTTGVSPYIKAIMNTAMEKTMISSLDETSYRGSDDGLSAIDHTHPQQFSSLNASEKVGLQMTQSIYRPFNAEESDEDPEVSDDSSSDGSLESIETIQSRPESIYDAANVGAEDWNMKFQMILDMPQDTTEEKLARARDLYKLTQDFIATATRIASTIIKEIGLIAAMKTIKPKAFGGLAGGEKFAEEGIFFKLVRDAYGIYGDDQFAFKTAAHELNGLKAYYRTGIKELHYPFMLVIDQRGFRIIATTRLPINKETLKYGSGDGGQTIHKDDKRLNRLMKRAAKTINIKGHVVGMSDHKKKIYGPVDIEAHKGQDGRYYIIDTARVFPPEPPQTSRVGLFIPSYVREPKDIWEPLPPMYHMPAFTAQHYMESIEKQLRSEDEPTDEAEVERVEFVDGTLYYLKYKNKKASINIRASTLIGRIIEGHAILVFKIGRSVFLYNLLRFSYVKKLDKPLSSDAMTPFGRHNADLNRAEVEDAYYELIGTEIPSFVESLQESSECFIRGELIRSIHDFGVNMRYIGLVRSLIKDETIIKSHLLSEMITRVTKNYVRSRLRAASTSHKSAIHIVLHHFNLLLGSSQASTFFWHFFIKAQIEAKFGRYGEALNKDELKTESDPRDSINKLCLFQLLQRQLGVEFTEEAQMRIFRNPDILKTKHPFIKTDIASLTVSYKHLFAPELRQQIVNYVSVQCGEDYDKSRKMLTDIFGEGSIEVANVFISEAYELHLQGKYENVRALVDKALGIFYDKPCACPLEITIKGFYLRACVAQHFNEEKEIVEANLRAAYDGLVLLTGSTCEKDDGIYAYEMDRPFALLILNKLAILLNEQKRIFESWAISLKFIFVWNNFSFPGTTLDCKETFDNEIPLPFIYIYERSKILGDSANVMQVFDIDKLIHNLINAVPQDSEKIFAWKNHVHMVGLSAISGFCLPPKVLEEYIEQKQYQSEIYTVLGDQLTERFNFPTIQGPSLLTEQSSLTLSVRLLISPSTLELSADSELYLAVIRQDQMPKQSSVVPFQAIVAKQRIAQLTHAPLATFKDLSLHPGAYSYNLITTTTNKNLLVFSIVPDVWGPTLHIIRSSGGLNICTMDLDLDRLNDDLNCTEEKVTCLDMWDNILVATKTGVVFEKVSPKESTKLSEREKLVEKYGWRRLKSFGSWKVVQVCCSDNHQILLTSTKEVFSWGCGDYGQLGHGDAVSRESPRLIERLKRAKIKFVSCGHNRSFAIDEDNRLYQWGIDFKFLPELHPFFNKNNIGIVEVCATPALPPPELAHLPDVWKQCICVYISDTGEAYWYAGKSKSATGNLEIMEPQDEFIIKVSIGYSHVVFLNNLGEVYASGEGDKGQLGLTNAELIKYTDNIDDLSAYSETLSPPPIAVKVPMPGKKKAVKVMASGFRSYALLEDGTLVKWGHDVVRPRPVVEFQNFSVADFSIGPHGLIATIGEPEKISQLDKEKKKIKKMSFLKQESKPVISSHDIKIHSISLTPVPAYTSWGDFLQACGFDTKTLAEYLPKFSKVKFDTNRIKVIGSNILDKIGVVDINHQLTILERIENIKQAETTHIIETKLNKLISALNEEAKKRHEGSLLSSSGGSSPGSLPSSLSTLQPSSSSTDLTGGLKSPLHRSNKDNNTNVSSSTTPPHHNTTSSGHSRNSSTGGLNMIV